MDHANTAQLAAVIGAVGIGLVLTARTRLVLLAGFGVLVVAEGGLVARRPTPTLALAGLFGLAVLAAAAVALARRPALITPLVLAAAPFRLPLNFDSHHTFLVKVASSGQLGRLLLLYAVLAVGALELALRVVRGAPVTRLPPSLVWPAVAFFTLSCVSLLWTGDLEAGRNLLAFFLVPFAVLVAVVARAPFPAWMSRVLAIEAVALATLFAVVGLWEAATRNLLFFASNLEVSNSYTSFFRVTSLFRDPSLYGRHVVLGIAVLLVALWLGRLNFAWAAALIAVLWAGLYFSYSQSSMIALFVTVVAITAVAGGRIGRRTVAVVAVISVLAAGGAVAAMVRHHSAQRVTSDRSRRVDLTWRVFAHHPIAGVGIGAQPHASQLIAPRPGPVKNFVSHTTPLTVLAELGLLGLAAYLALLAGAARMLERVHSFDPALGLSLGAVLLALLVHSFFYSGFFEDPVAWLVLGVAASFLASTSVRAQVVPQPTRDEVREPVRTP